MSAHRTIVTLLVAATLAVTGCKKSQDGKAELPPASGEGAAPLPEIPAIAAAGSGSGSGAAAAAAGDTKTTGSLVAKSQITIGARSSGTIVEIKVDENSVVKKGDVLFRLDSRDAALMRKSALTALRGAKLGVANAQREYDRAKSLHAQNALPQMQLDNAQAALEGAQVLVAQAENSVAMANKAIADATVRSPISGVVINKLMSVGEYATMMPPSPVLIVQDQSVLELKFRLPEKALASLHVDDKVAVTIPALGVHRAATISEISPQADPRTRTIELTAAIDNKDGALRPGLAAEVVLGAPPPEPTAEQAAPAVAPVPAPAPKAKTPTKAAHGKAAPRKKAPATRTP